jgi:hypothetical protein
MLTALILEEQPPDGFWQHTRAFLNAGKPETEEVAASGVRMKRVRYVHRVGRLPWNKLRALCGGTVLFDGQLPPESGMRVYRDPALWERTACLAALEVLRRAQIAPRTLRAALYDPQGKYASFMGALAPYSAHLCYATDRRESAEEVREKLMERCGAAVTVGGEEVLYGCRLVVAPARIRRPLPVQGALLFTGVPPAAPLGGTVADGYRIPVPEAYEPFLTPAVPQRPLLEALYRLCGKTELARLPPVAFRCGGRYLPIEPLCRSLQALV